MFAIALSAGARFTLVTVMAVDAVPGSVFEAMNVTL